MVYIRITGQPSDIAATTELLSRVMRVLRIEKAQPTGSGNIAQSLSADPDEATCLHPVGEVVRRGIPEIVGDAGYLVEYGVCVSCQARVVRVRVESGTSLRSVGLWSELVEVETPKAYTSI